MPPYKFELGQTVIAEDGCVGKVVDRRWTDDHCYFLVEFAEGCQWISAKKLGSYSQKRKQPQPVNLDDIGPTHAWLLCRHYDTNKSPEGFDTLFLWATANIFPPANVQFNVVADGRKTLISTYNLADAVKCYNEHNW